MAKEGKKQHLVEYVYKTKIILKKYFQNGFRFNSQIELERFKNFYNLENNCELQICDVKLREIIEKHCFCHSQKFFFMTQDECERLQNLLDFVFATDTNLIYYDTFYEKHDEFLSSINIFSAAMLKDVLHHINQYLLRELFEKNKIKNALKHIQFPLKLTRSYFSNKSDVTPEKEISKCFQGASMLNYEELDKRLPYINPDKIKQILAQNETFIYVSKGTYTHVSKINITDEDKQNVQTFVSEKLRDKGYLSLYNLKIDNILEYNSEFTQSAVLDAVYQECLSSNYKKRGTIITQNGSLDFKTIIGDFCNNTQSCTLDELYKLEEDLYGVNHYLSLNIAYQFMIRTDINTFVSDKDIYFDIKKIDEVLGRFCIEDYVPLQQIKDFSMFPAFAYHWNSFLLESYARRFSQTFRFDVPAPNSRCVGVIVRQSSQFTDYTQLLADVIAKASIPLDRKDVVDFLYENGYTGRRMSGNIDSLIVLASSKREGK